MPDSSAEHATTLANSRLHRALTLRKQVLYFVLLAYGISWILWIPLLVRRPFSYWFYYGGVLGPAAAAVILSAMEGPTALAALRRMATRWRVPLLWYALALLLPLAVRAISILAFSAIRGRLVPIVLPPLSTFLPFAVLILFLVPFEELGWRGYALPRLQQRYSPMSASLAVGVIWGLWHVPLAWVGGGFQASERPLAYMARFVITILPISCLATWLFNRSGGSVIIVSLYHFSIDMSETLLVLPAAVGTTLLWLSTILASLLVLAIWRFESGRPAPDREEGVGHPDEVHLREGALGSAGALIGRIIRLPPVLFLGFLVLGSVAQAFRPLPIGLPSFALGMSIGSGILVLAVALAWAALSELKRQGTTAEPGQPPKALVTSGILGRMRNPLYLALLLLLTAIAVMADSFWLLLATPLLWLSLDKMVVRSEERILEELFGGQYIAYTRAVRRWV